MRNKRGRVPVVETTMDVLTRLSQRPELEKLAANCGIDARNMSTKQVREAHNKQKEGDPYADQHDARLDEFLKRVGA